MKRRSFLVAGVGILALLAGSAAYLLAKHDSRPLSAIPPEQRHNYFTQPPPVDSTAARPLRAVVKTRHGDLVFRLHADSAPIAVGNFVFLASQGFYDGLTFHRVIKDYLAQGGDPLGTGVGGPGYRIRGEISKTRRFDRPGLLAFAGSATQGQGSQFFVTLKAAPHLDGQYPILGELISGQEVLASLPPREPDLGGSDSAPERIERVAVFVEE
jgi:cyclophilin family peptidyl-prolyl cis-trans isomerase